MKKIIVIYLLLLNQNYSFGQWSEVKDFGNSKKTHLSGEIKAILVKTPNIIIGGALKNTKNNYYLGKFIGNYWDTTKEIPSSPNGTSIINTICDGYDGIYIGCGPGPASIGQGNYVYNILSLVTPIGASTLLGDNGIFSVISDTKHNLYAAGAFSISTGSPGVVKWDGKKWNELGSGANSLNVYGNRKQGYISSMVSDSIDNIYAAGNFTNSMGKYYVAKWDGKNWSELGSGSNSLNLNGTIRSMTIDKNGNIYVAGSFTNSKGKYYVAKWNNTTWIELGDSTNSLNANSHIFCLNVDNKGNLYCGGGFTNSNGKYYVAKWDGNNWSELGVGNNLLNANGLIRCIAIDEIGNLYCGGLFKNTDGYQYVAKYANTTLPMTILNFTSSQDKNSIKLIWQSTNEVNASHFYLQRSVDGISFTNIDKIMTKGNGSYNTKDYLSSFSESIKKVYYRLQIVDKDGGFIYSKIIAVDVNPQLYDFNLYPNPVNGTLLVQLISIKSKRITLQVIDMQGKVFQHQTLEINGEKSFVRINTSELPKGTYVILINNSDLQERKQFVKE